ncbi:1,4-dihydroxy-2-naphthoate octaprenyltransferase [Frondihabitans sp. 762G35]|uniref:UbiA family prenyltransferase n=1 Tax=Frondihabitans sp. 762G35 TaxID=1446794 RepID=UPI000D216DE7|nr:UbiA family prenyltransferase [Frondihabitans sp. 762G35]ARC57577.1 1,4-dihydroxy-2-naphthoate octaprenyltransferase [Frondihabitans sp. 762G35]
MLSRARSLALSSHPGPTLAVTILAALLATGLGYAPARILVIAVAVLLGQLSIGFSNDWIDAERDRVAGRTDKPVAQGLVPVRLVRRAAITTAVVALAVSVALGRPAAVAHAVLIASGWAYNAGLKRTPFSVVPFVVAFGLLPDIVTLAGQYGQPAAVWALLAGAFFGVAIHFTNVLPDLADDEATDVRGLPHRLGARASGIVAFAALVVAGLFTAFGPVVAHPVNGVSAISIVGLVVTLGIALVGIRLVLTREPDRTLFRLVIAASLVIAVELVLSGTRLVG